MKCFSACIKQNKCYVFVNVHTHIALVATFWQRGNVPAVTKLFVDCLLNHSLNAVFAIQFAFVGTHFVHDDTHVLTKKVLPVDFVAAIKKLVKVSSRIFCHLNVHTVAGAQTKICAVHGIFFADKTYSSWRVTVKFVSQKFELISEDFLSTDCTQCNVCIHIYKVTLFIIVCRSEEHTSELQSPDHLVCRLL